MKKTVWFVLKTTKIWEWDENLKMFVWVEKSRWSTEEATNGNDVF
jgi:hypothetical protein